MKILILIIQKIIIMSSLIILVACAPGSLQNLSDDQLMPTKEQLQTPSLPVYAPEVDPVETPTKIPTMVDGLAQTPDVTFIVSEMLADRLGVEITEVVITSIEEVQWPDGCLGVAQPDEMCTQAIVDGYKIILTVYGTLYEFHTDIEGNQIREVLSPAPLGGLNMISVVKIAREYLSTQLDVELTAVNMMRMQQVNWPDSCLGIRSKGQMCAEVITPGYLILFDVNGKKYEIHSDQTGSNILLADGLESKLLGKTIVFQFDDNGTCRKIEIEDELLLVGDCQSQLENGKVSYLRIEELRELVTIYDAFTAETNQGIIEFLGQGRNIASPSEQRSIVEWARQVFREADSGNYNNTEGLLFVWHREGGFAGFCDDMVIHSSGWVTTSSCKGNNAGEKTKSRIKAEYLDVLFEWTDQYKNFNASQKDPAVADAMEISVSVLGTGTKSPSSEETQEILYFGEIVFNDMAK